MKNDDEPLNRPTAKRNGLEPVPSPPAPNTMFATDSMASIAQHFSTELTATDMLGVLQSAMRHDADGRGMMFTQAQIHDTLFHRLTLKAMSGVDSRGQPVKDYVSECNIHLALRTQKQCRSTLEAMNIMSARAENSARKNKNHEQKEGLPNW